MKQLSNLKRRAIVFLVGFLMALLVLPVGSVVAEEYEYEPVTVKTESIKADSEVEQEDPDNYGYTDGGAALAFDGDETTCWHTDYNEEDKVPHYLYYELEETTEISRIEYVGKPGAQKTGNGVFKQIAIYVSTNEEASAGVIDSGNIDESIWNNVYSSTQDITYENDDPNGTMHLEARKATFDFESTEANKVLIVVNSSYSSNENELEDTYANALEINTYKRVVNPHEKPEYYTIEVKIDGETYYGDSLQSIVEDEEKNINVDSAKSFEIVSGTITKDDMVYLGGGDGNNFLFRNIEELIIDISSEDIEYYDSKKALKDNIFKPMPMLKNLSLRGFETIGINNFIQAGNRGSGLEEIDIPNVKSIGSRAFQGAKISPSLTTLNLSSVNNIGDNAFEISINNIDEIKLDSVITIGDNAFKGIEIDNLTLPSTLTGISKNMFDIAEGGSVTLNNKRPVGTGKNEMSGPYPSSDYPFGLNSYTLKVPNGRYEGEHDRGLFGDPDKVTLEIQDPTYTVETSDNGATYKSNLVLKDELYVANVKMGSTADVEYYINDGNGGITDQGASADNYNVSYDRVNNVLTLKDAELTKSSFSDYEVWYGVQNYPRDVSNDAVIFSFKDGLTIKVIGNNTIANHKQNPATYEGLHRHGIFAYGSLTMEGDGRDTSSLEASSTDSNDRDWRNSMGILTYSNLTIKDVSIEAIAEETTYTGSGLMVDGGNLNIIDSTVEVISKEVKPLNGNTGSVAYSWTGSYGLSVYAIEAEDGSMIGGDCKIYNSELKIDSGAGYSSVGFPCESAIFTDSTINVTSSADSNYSYALTGDITLNNSKVIGKSKGAKSIGFTYNGVYYEEKPYSAGYSGTFRYEEGESYYPANYSFAVNSGEVELYSGDVRGEEGSISKAYVGLSEKLSYSNGSIAKYNTEASSPGAKVWTKDLATDDDYVLENNCKYFEIKTPTDTVIITPQSLSAYTGGDNLLDKTGFPNMRYEIVVPDGADISDGITLYTENGTDIVTIKEDDILNNRTRSITSSPIIINELVVDYYYGTQEVINDIEPGVYSVELETDVAYAEIDGLVYDVVFDNEDTDITIRNLTDPEEMKENKEEYLSEIKSSDPTSRVSEPIAVIKGKEFYTNGRTDMKVQNTPAVKLLSDDLILDNGFSREQLLNDKADAFLRYKGISIANRTYEYKYFDLVNTMDGNAWVSSANGTDIYYPYPAGTNRYTDFEIIHFEGLHREYGYEGADVLDAINDATLELVDYECTEYGIKFHVDEGGFSPFAISWKTRSTRPDRPYVDIKEDETDCSKFGPQWVWSDKYNACVLPRYIIVDTSAK